MAGGSWKNVKEDWWFAFVFFLDQAYYTGRSDELSKKFEKAAVQALESLIVGATSDERLQALKQHRHRLDRSQYDNRQNLFRKALESSGAIQIE